MAVHANTYLSPDKKEYTENRDNTHTNIRANAAVVSVRNRGLFSYR